MTRRLGGLGGRMSSGGTGNRRGKMLALKEREIQAQAEYVSGIGCKDLGDLTNAVRLLERALKGGYRPAR